MSGAPLFHLKHIRKTYASETDEVVALDIENLRISRGCVTAILGNSGSGKTTLLNILSMLDRPDQPFEKNDDGPNPEILATCFEHHGLPSVDLLANDEKLTNLRKDTFGFIFQEGYLLSNLVGRWNFEIPLHINGLDLLQPTLGDLANSVGLTEKQEERTPSDISGGEAQRIAVIRSIIHNPKVVIADEPSSNLDPNIGRRVMRLLTDWCHEDEDRTLIWVTHNLQQAAEYADEVVIMSGGTASEVYGNSKDDPDLLLSLMNEAEQRHRSVASPNDGPAPGNDSFSNEIKKTGKPFLRNIGFITGFAANDLFPVASGTNSRGPLQWLIGRKCTQVLNILSLFMIMLLALFLLNVHFSLYDYFVSSETDDRINNFKVIGKTGTGGTSLNNKDAAKLRSLVWATHPGSLQEIVATKREVRQKQLTVQRPAIIDAYGARLRTMDVFIKKEKRTYQKTASLDIVWVEAQDPILGTISMLDGDIIDSMIKGKTKLSELLNNGRNPTSDQDKSDVFNPKQPRIVIRRDRLKRDLGYDHLPSTLTIDIDAKRQEVPLLGVTDWLPYNASILSINDWYEIIYTNRGSKDKLPGYEYITLYIGHPIQDGLPIAEKVHDLGYFFYDNIRARLAYIKDLTDFVLMFSLIALIGAGAIVCGTLFVSYTDAIKRKQKEIGVLLAFGIGYTRLYSIFFTEVVMVWLVAVLLVVPAGIVTQKAMKLAMVNILEINPAQASNIIGSPPTIWFLTIMITLFLATASVGLAIRMLSRLSIAEVMRKS